MLNKLRTMKFLAILLVTTFLDGALANPVTKCTQYQDCMTTTIEQVSPECGDSGCSFKVCYTLSNVGDDGNCDKGSGGTFSHVCDNASGEDLLEQCNVAEMANKPDWKYIGTDVPGFSACQYVEAGGYAYFTAKDGGGCADSFSDSLAISGNTGSATYKCEESDDLGVTGELCSGGGVNECVFSVGPMPDCEGGAPSGPETRSGIDAIDVGEGPCIMNDGDAQCVFDHAVVQTPENFEVFISLDQVAQGENSQALFELTFMNAPFGYPGLKAKAWCVDYDRQISDGFFMTDLYSSYDDDFPDDAVDRPGNLKMITWMLNHYDVGDVVESCESETIEFEDIQIAVWKIVDDISSPSLQAEGTTYAHNECISLYLKEQAFLHADYEPSCEDPDEIVAVIVVVDDEDVITHQVIVAEILMSEICECPMEEEAEVCYTLANGTATNDEFAGFVCLDVSFDSVSVRYDLREDYELLNTAVWAGSDISTMPGGSSPDVSSFPHQEDLLGLGKVNHTMEISLDLSAYCAEADSLTMSVVVYASVSNNETASDSVPGSSYVIGPAVDTYGVSAVTDGSWSYMELTVDCTCNAPTASPTFDINLAPPLDPVDPSGSPTASPTFGINLAPPLDPPTNDDEEEDLCLCVDEFVSETTEDYIVSTQELDLSGISVATHSRRVTERGATYVDAILVVVGDTTLEVSSSGYFLDGVEASLPASFLGYTVTETVESYDKIVKIHFGSAFLELISRQGSLFTKMLMNSHVF